MKITRIGIFLAACCFAAQADMVTFVTPSGATTSGGPVDDSATVTTGSGTITVSLTNLEANPTDAAQNLSDFEFTLSGATTTGATFAAVGNSGQEITVNDGGTFSLGTTLTTASGIDWGLSTPTSTEIDLDRLANANNDHLIIGPPGPGNLYSDANGSIAGNGPHNPFLNQTVTWVIDAPNVSAGTTVTAATFSFGTEEGAALVPGVPSTTPVPEPGFYGLLAAGLGGLLIAARRSSVSRN